MSKQNGALVERKPQASEAPAIVGLQALERAADYVVKSGLFGVRSREQAVALMLLAQAEGIHPMRAIQEYHIIQGRPAMRADAMLARFIAAGGKVVWHELSDEAAEATFKHPAGGEVRIRWDKERARKAGLLDKQGSNWQKYPRAMLRARVISEGIRTVYPNVIVGVYTPEEVQDFVDEEPVEAEVVKEPSKSSNGNGRNGHRAALIREFKETFEALKWTPEEGRAFLGELFGKESAKDLTDDELARAVKEMKALLERKKQEEKDIPIEPKKPQEGPQKKEPPQEKGDKNSLWQEVWALCQKKGINAKKLAEYVRHEFGKELDNLTNDELKDLIERIKIF